MVWRWDNERVLKEMILREWVSMNGCLMPADEARVSVFDSGFMQGIGLFETMRSYAGRIFRLEQHLDRLANSARALGWTAIPEPERMSVDIEQVLGVYDGMDARVRLTVTTGSLLAAAVDEPELTVVASAALGGQYPAECYAQGVTVLASDWRQSRNDITAGHKTTSYFARLYALRWAHARAAFEVLWLNHDGHVAEGAISSIFVVRNEELITPPLDTPILPGITRAAVIELAHALEMAVEEGPLTVEDVQTADEMFLTNSMMEIVPVVRLGHQPIGNEKPGEVTRELASAYAQLVTRECGHE
ncbi:MAG: aminotransferase class IV [Planctomycetota bacterium]